MSIFYTSFLIAQEMSTSSIQDSLANQGISFGEINLPTPSSYIENYQYDPISDMYYYNLSVADYSINYPIILTPEEYKKLILVEDLKEYYKSKIDAAEGKKDGTDEMQERLNRVLTNDPGLGVARHVDAGYSKAIKVAKNKKYAQLFVA